MTAVPDTRAGLPGELIMWVLIVSELAVFGAALLIFLVLRLGDPAGFAAAQDQLHRLSAGVNTMVLVTSGLAAALAVRAAEGGQGTVTRRWLAAGQTDRPAPGARRRLAPAAPVRGARG